MIRKCLLGLAIVAVAGGSAAVAQQNAIKRTPLQKIDFPGGYNIVTVIAEVPPNVLAGRHTHPGVDTGYVVDGEATLMVEGKPDQMLTTGDSYAVPAGVAHDIKTGAKGLKLMAVYVVEAGKPVATPAPLP